MQSRATLTSARFIPTQCSISRTAASQVAKPSKAAVSLSTTSSRPLLTVTVRSQAAEPTGTPIRRSWMLPMMSQGWRITS